MLGHREFEILYDFPQVTHKNSQNFVINPNIALDFKICRNSGIFVFQCYRNSTGKIGITRVKRHKQNSKKAALLHSLGKNLNIVRKLSETGLLACLLLIELTIIN